MELLTVIFTVSLVIVVQAQQQPIVDKTVIVAGGTFTVTCDINRFASNDIPSTAPYISDLSLERTVGTSARTVIVSYSPLAPAGFPNQTMTIPPGRNWVINATGGVSTNNRNSIKITVVVKDATCADAGIYRCNAIYFSTATGKGSADRFQNITAKAITEDPVFTVIPRNGLEPDESTNTVGENVILTCKVGGPYGLVLSWLTGPASGSDFSPYPFTNDIQMVTPSPPTPTDIPCPSTDYESILNMTVKLGKTMYICVVTDSSVEVIRKNFTIDGKPTTTENPDDGKSSDPETSGANVGAIVGGVIGGLVLIAIIVIVVYFCWYRKRNDDDSGRDKEVEATDATHAPPPVFYAEPKKVKKDERDGVTSVDTETWDKPNYDGNALYTNHGQYHDSDDYPQKESRGGRKSKKTAAHNNPSYIGDSPHMQENHYASTDVSRSEDESDVPLEKPKPKRRSRTPTHDQRGNEPGLHYAVLDIQQPRRSEQPEKNRKYEEVPVQYAEIQV